MSNSFLRQCGILAQLTYCGEHFKKICQVGEGYGGRVFKTADKLGGDTVALKVINLKTANRERAVEEVRNHMKLHHHNIIRLRQVYQRNSFVYLVLDYAELGDLQQFLLEKRGGVLPENMAKYFFIQIVKGIEYMHSQGIVSRDIKLTNILVQTNKDDEEQLPTIKLCDFGFSCDCTTDKTTACVGTPEYVPPEVIQANGVAAYDGFKVDAWSCAVVLYNLVTGYQPFSGNKIGAKHDKKKATCFISKILNVDYTFPTNVHLSRECISLIEGCLVRNPKDRMSIEDILRHPWLN